MAIPDYQSLLLPFLRRLSDGAEHTSREVTEQLAAEFGLTPEERSEYLPSGGARIFDNRVGWARAYLKKALLLQSPARGIYTITDRGRKVLSEHPDKLDVDYLKRFPEFIAFLNTSKSNKKPVKRARKSKLKAPRPRMRFWRPPISHYVMTWPRTSWRKSRNAVPPFSKTWLSNFCLKWDTEDRAKTQDRQSADRATAE